MAAGRTTSARRGNSKIHGYLPVAESRPLLADHLFAVTCVRFVTDAAGAPFATIYYMYIMEIPVAVAETGIKGCIGIAEEVLLMASEAQAICAFFVGGIDFGGVTSPKHAKIIRTVRVVAGFTFTRSNRPMEIFFSFKLFFDVTQWGSPGIVLVVTPETGCHLIRGEEKSRL